MWDQGWRGTGPKMARIRKIPDTWTLEIHAIVLKDSRPAEHEEIGCMKTTRWSSAYSNIKRGGRGAQKKETLENKTTRWSSAYSNIKRGGRGAEKKETLENKTTRWSSAYSNIKRGGRGAQKKETLETKRNDKTKLSVLEHQTWWERSSKRKEGDVQRKGRSNVWTIMAKRRVLMDLFWDQKGIDFPTEGWRRYSFDKNYPMQEASYDRKHHTTGKATVRLWRNSFDKNYPMQEHHTICKATERVRRYSFDKNYPMQEHHTTCKATERLRRYSFDKNYPMQEHHTICKATVRLRRNSFW